MLAPKLAFRNIISAGLRTWLNVVALSFSFVAIIFLQGFYDGLNDQAERSTVDVLYGGGQYWQEAYDPYDPLTLEDAHAPVPPPLQNLVAVESATPLLIRTATIYPRGRFRPILLKGIDPDQQIVSIPSSLIGKDTAIIPGMIGTRMSKNAGLKKGDLVTVQWRDVHGTFDARDVTIVERVFHDRVGNRQRADMDSSRPAAGVYADAGAGDDYRAEKDLTPPGTIAGWEFRDLPYLLRDLRALVRMKSIQGSIMYLLLLFLAMLAIFDTQVLSIWRRRKEMGTLMALGMTRTQVIRLFTLEGAFHGLLAACAAALYGIPLLAIVANRGMALPAATDSFGFSIGERLFPVYSPVLVVGTTLLVCIVTTIVSYIPTRKISHLKPTDALRGRTS